MAIALLALMIAAAPVARAAEPRFTRARLGPDSLCFDSPVELDWENLARRDFTAFPLDKPPVDRLASHPIDLGEPTFDFVSPLPESLRRLYFYLLSETGARAIQPERLVGYVRYSYRPPKPAELAVFYGYVCTSIPSGLEDAGFVVATDTPVTWKSVPIPILRSGSEIMIHLPSGPSRLPPHGSRGAADVKTMYLLSAPGIDNRYLFVRRVPDDECLSGCCVFSYDLFRWEPDLPAVLWSAYDCDV